jgi:hypothetical protein
MADTTTVMALPFPEGSDANDVPADMQALAERLDEAPGIESLTSAQIAALTAGQKPAGRVVYNSTTSKLQVSNGSTFANIDAAALLLAGGTMAGNIAMGSNKVTGLAAATTNGDAVRYEQVLLLAGGTMSGAIAMGGNKVTGLAAASANGDAVRYDEFNAVGTYTTWSPAATGSSANPTANSSTGRYTQIGDHVSGWGRIVGFTYGGSGTIRLSLPVTPAATSGSTRLGTMQIYSSVTGTLAHFQLELYSDSVAQPIRQTHGVSEDGDSLVTFKYLTGSDMSTFVTSGTVTVEYNFSYEVA